MPYFVFMLVMVVGVAITTFGITTWIHVQDDRSAAARKAAADAGGPAEERDADRQEREPATSRS